MEEFAATVAVSFVVSLAVPHRMLAVLGGVAALVGAVFTLQGLGVLGGSFMSGSPTWAVIGMAMVVGGLVGYAWATRSR